MIIYDMEDVPISRRYQDLAEITLNQTLDYLKFDYEVDVSFTTTNNAVIQEINQEYRAINKATDVLSFPLIDWPSPCDYDYLEEGISLYMNPDNNHILLGDIVLSMDKVKDQAEAYGHSEEREYVFLILHSLLHLFGYDHMTEDDEKEMIRLQKEILQNIDYNNCG